MSSGNPPGPCLSDRARAFSVSSLIGSSRLLADGVNSVEETKFQCTNKLNHYQERTAHDSSYVPIQNVSAELLCRELWLEFHTLGTEMIITKAGRRMFPSLKVHLSGLEEDKLYIVYVDMNPVDDKRYRYIYQSSKWVPAGPGDVPHQERLFLHPDGPQLGKFWNRQSCVAFDKMKLTNSRQPSQRDQISLHSMHRYQPKLYIQSIPGNCREPLVNSPEWWRTFCQEESDCTVSFAFPETQFITVTAYQNQQITRLKIASNPFAKGFRESSRETRNVDVTEDEEAPSTKKTRSSSIGTSFSKNSKNGINTDSLNLADFNSWNAFHSATLTPVHHWWIQQHSIFHTPFHIMPPIPVSHDQTVATLQHHHCVLSDSPFL